MLGSFGPFDFNPGDSQYVLVKLAVGRDTDRLTAITEMRSILNGPFDFPVDVADEAEAIVPHAYTLAQNIPNPFNSGTSISYSLPEKSHVTIRIFNILGQEVKTVVDEFRNAGEYSVRWDGRNNSGRSVSTGLYLYRIEAGDYSGTRKMLFLK